MRIRLLSGRWKLLLIAALVLAMVPLMVWGQSGYFLFYPGMAVDTGEMVTVLEASEAEGRFLMTTVKAHEATFGQLVYGVLNPRIGVYHRRQVIPPEMDMDDYSEYAKEMMAESQAVAVLLAHRHLGRSVEVTGDGVVLMQVVPGSTWSTFASGLDPYPEEGDVIVALDEMPVDTLDDLTALLIQALVEDREAVNLSLHRGEEKLEARLPTFMFPEEGLREGLWVGAIGAVMKTRNLSVTPSVDIQVDAGEVGGPSAGLIFLLEMINQLSADDLTGGRTVAGTGALSETGEVLPVGGVRQKVMAAEEAGADVFFVPRWMVPEATRAADHVEVVPVGTLNDALIHLQDSP